MNSSKKGASIFLNLLLGFLGLALPFLSESPTLFLLLIPCLLYCAVCQLDPLGLSAIFPAALLAGGLLSGHLFFSCAVLLVLLPGGLLSRLFLRRRWGWKRSALLLSGYFFLLICAAVCTATVLSRGALTPHAISGFLGDWMAGLCENYKELYLSGLSQGQSALMAPALEEMLTAARAFFDQCFVGLFAAVSSVLAFFCLFIARFAASLRTGDRALRDVSNYKVSKHGAVLFSLSLLLSFFGGRLGIFGLNLCYVLTPALMLQGLGFVSFLLARRRDSGRGPGFYYLLILLLLLLFPIEAVAVIAGIFGVVDTFTSLRQTAE